jgi:hypothetical protein
MSSCAEFLGPKKEKKSLNRVQNICYKWVDIGNKKGANFILAAAFLLQGRDKARAMRYRYYPQADKKQKNPQIFLN